VPSFVPLSHPLAALRAISRVCGTEVLEEVELAMWQCDSEFLHSNGLCVRAENQDQLASPRVVSLKEAVALEESVAMDVCGSCGGWANTEPGRKLQALAESIAVIDMEEIGDKGQNWAHVEELLNVWTEAESRMKDKGDSRFDALRVLDAKIALCAYALAVSSAGSLSELPVLDALASQAVIAPVTPALGAEFSKWAQCKVKAILEGDPANVALNLIFDRYLPSLEKEESAVVLVGAAALSSVSVLPDAVRLLRLLAVKSKGLTSEVDQQRCIAVKVKAPCAHALDLANGHEPYVAVLPLGEEVSDHAVNMAGSLWSPTVSGPMSLLSNAFKAAMAVS